MKRVYWFSLILFLSIGLGFSQELETDAPNEDYEELEMTEVTTVEGVVYFDGKMTYASEDVSFKIVAEDEGAGVDVIYYALDNGATEEYMDPISFDSEGYHIIRYMVKDNVGNMSLAENYEFILDMTPPALKLSVSMDVEVVDGVNYVSALHAFKIQAIDNLSGVESISYTIDGENEMVYDEEFIPEVEDGTHTIEYFATDNVGNVSEVFSYEYFKDSNAPELSLSFDPEAYVDADENYISGTTLVSLSATDEETEVSRIIYSVDGDEYMEYFAPFTLDEGTHKISAFAYDLMGNESVELSIEATVDGSLPSAEIVEVEE